MPIDSLSDKVRMPRLGKIRLGTKEQSNKTGSEYPKASDHFIVPPEVAEIYGDSPTELDIMFPVEDREAFAPQYLRCYSQMHGLICIGDEINGHRKVDTQTGDIVHKDSATWEWREMACNPNECPQYQKGQCRRIMNLLVLLPYCRGLGCYQIDTSSYYSIVNINSAVRMLKGMLGRCSMLPLTLTLGPQEVIPPGGSKKTVYVLNIKQDMKLSDLARSAQLPPAKALLPDTTQDIPEEHMPYIVESENMPQEEESRQPEEQKQQSAQEPAKDTTEEKKKKGRPAKKDTPKQSTTNQKQPVTDQRETPNQEEQQTTQDQSRSSKDEAMESFPDDRPASDEEKRGIIRVFREQGFADEDTKRMIVEATGKQKGYTPRDLHKAEVYLFKKLSEKTEDDNGGDEAADDIDGFLRQQGMQ